MNYATDRLDRRARHSNSDTNNSKTCVELDLEKANNILENDPTNTFGHVLAANACRDIGWNYLSTYHYAMAWIHHHPDDDDNNSVEMAGTYIRYAYIKLYSTIHSNEIDSSLFYFFYFPL